MDEHENFIERYLSIYTSQSQRNIGRFVYQLAHGNKWGKYLSRCSRNPNKSQEKRDDELLAGRTEALKRLRRLYFTVRQPWLLPSSNIPTSLVSAHPRIRDGNDKLPVSIDWKYRIHGIKLFNGKDATAVWNARFGNYFRKMTSGVFHPLYLPYWFKEEKRDRGRRGEVERGEWFTSWKVSRENQEYYRFCRMWSWIILACVKYL